MIADDIDAIRAGIRKLAQDKVLAEAEAAKRAAAECKPANLPETKALFPEQGAPFRGFFVTEDGDIVPYGNADRDGKTLAGCATRFADAVQAFRDSERAINNDGTVNQQAQQQSADPWDDVTLDGGSHMWGTL